MPKLDLALDWKHLSVLVVYAALTGVFNLVFSKKSQIDEWCEANPRLAFVAKFMRGAGLDPWAIAQSAVLLVLKSLPSYQKQSLADVTTKISKPPFLPLISFLLCFGAILVFCSNGCKELVSPSALSAEQQAAALICKQYFGEKKGLSLEDAAKAFCATDEQLAPFLHEVLGAKQRAGATAERSLSAPDGGEAGAK